MNYCSLIPLCKRLRAHDDIVFIMCSWKDLICTISKKLNMQCLGMVLHIMTLIHTIISFCVVYRCLPLKQEMRQMRGSGLLTCWYTKHMRSFCNTDMCTYNKSAFSALSIRPLVWHVCMYTIVFLHAPFRLNFSGCGRKQNMYYCWRGSWRENSKNSVKEIR